MAKITPKSIFVPSALLTVICLVISAALAFTNSITKDRIAEINYQNQVESMSAIFPEEGNEFGEKEIDGTTYYEVVKDGSTVGYVFTTSATGYGGEIKVMTGMEPDGKVRAVEVLSCDDETPGLGATAKGNAEFLGQFSGKSSAISTEKNKDVDALTGATITTTAVINSVNEAIELYGQLRGESGK